MNGKINENAKNCNVRGNEKIKLRKNEYRENENRKS